MISLDWLWVALEVSLHVDPCLDCVSLSINDFHIRMQCGYMNGFSCPEGQSITILHMMILGKKEKRRETRLARGEVDFEGSRLSAD